MGDLVLMESQGRVVVKQYAGHGKGNDKEDCGNAQASMPSQEGTWPALIAV